MGDTTIGKELDAIPAAVRKLIGSPDTGEVEFLLEGGKVVMRQGDPSKPLTGAARFVGKAGPGPSTDEIMKGLRGDPAEDPPPVPGEVEAN